MARMHPHYVFDETTMEWVGYKPASSFPEEKTMYSSTPAPESILQQLQSKKFPFKDLYNGVRGWVDNLPKPTVAELIGALGGSLATIEQSSGIMSERTSTTLFWKVSGYKDGELIEEVDKDELEVALTKLWLRLDIKITPVLTEETLKNAEDGIGFWSVAHLPLEPAVLGGPATTSEPYYYPTPAPYKHSPEDVTMRERLLQKQKELMKSLEEHQRRQEEERLYREEEMRRREMMAPYYTNPPLASVTRKGSWKSKL